MYRIKQAAARAGISVPLLRAWERRYGVVSPERTPSGYRLYDEEAIAVLRAMRRLVDDGWSPSTAAERVRNIDPAAVRELATGRRREPSGDGEASELVGRFVAAARDLDVAAMESLLDEMLSRGSFEAAAERQLLPALRALGAAWAEGTVDVAAEHAASHAVLRRLAIAFDAASRADHAHGSLLVGLPPGVRHELGALAFAVTARRSGLPILYLGPDLPLEDWIEAARQARARGAVIGAHMTSDVEPAVQVAAALRAVIPDILVAFGGREAGTARAAMAGHDGPAPLELPDDLRRSVEELRRGLDPIS